MITDAEVRRLARSECVEPRIVELDYALDIRVPCVVAALPTKLDARAVPDTGFPGMLERRYEFRAHWERDLTALLPQGLGLDFDEVWAGVTDYVGRVVDRATCDRGAVPTYQIAHDADGQSR